MVDTTASLHDRSRPGWAFWLTVLVGAPLAGAALFLLVADVAPGLVPPDGEAELVAYMLLCAGLGAVLPRALPRVRSVPLTVRRGWALFGALVAGVSALPWVIVLLFTTLVLFCDGECLR